MSKLYLNVWRYLTLSLIFCAATAFAQNQSVSGKVTGDDGLGIPGANVLEKGTTNGSVTDADGKFSISVGENATLVISFIGYKSQEVVVGTQSTVNVTLAPDVAALSEVVVVGYGTVKSKDLTGSVAVVNEETFNKGLIQTPEQLFQGRTPGINVLPASGEPGAASTITIRGSSSIRGNQDPLYIIDGVPLDNSNAQLGTQSGIDGGSTPKNPLLFLNPNDIANITVLKDASSAAIYGSRAANGVIIVTTKSGKGVGKKGQFTFNTSVSISNPAKKYDLLSTQDFVKGVAKELISSGVNADTAVAQVLRSPLNRKSSTDWQEQIYRPGGAVSKGYNLSWAMSDKGTSLRLSGSYDDQQGIIKNSGLKRLTGRINFGQTFLDNKLKLDVSATYANIKNSYVPNTNQVGYQGSLIGAAIIFNPTAPIYNLDGTFFDPQDGNRNPVEMLAYFTDTDVTKRLVSNVQLSYEIIKGLTAKGTFGYNLVNTQRNSFADPRLSSNAFPGGTAINAPNGDLIKTYDNVIQGNGRAVYQYLTNNSYLTEWTLNYNKTFGSSTIDAVGGFSYQSFETNNHADVAWGQSITDPLTGATRAITYASDPFIKDINAFRFKADAYIPNFSKYTIASYFGRVNYNLSEKYYFTGTVRADGASKFGKNNKFGVFPAAAVKWKVNNEDFASSLNTIFSDFNLRANYGVLGSQDGLVPYAAVNNHQLYAVNGSLKTVDYAVNANNSDLRWEQQATLGVGLDWTLKSGRLSGTFDYFDTQRKNLIYNGATPGGFGGGPRAWQNLPGVVINTGFETSINYEIIQKGKFNWNASYNMTFYHNTFNKFTSPPVLTGKVDGQGLTGATAQVIQNGQSLFSWNLPVFTGFDANGVSQYANNAANKIVGSALPKFQAGLTNNLSYGNWNMSIFVNSTTGFNVYNNTANAYFLAGSLKTAHNVTSSVYTSNENALNPGAVSTRFLEKGDFIRLSNVTLSHNFKVDGKYIKNLSLSLSGQNLYVWTNYTGLDPEVNVDKNNNGVPSRGFDYAGYPKPRTYTLGLNIIF